MAAPLPGPSAPIDLASEPAFQLGALSVRPSLREVASDSFREVLEPRVMEVLVALARGRGATVSRAQLVDSCWGGRVVGEDAINRCVGELRALAVRADGAGFQIETVRKVGWRLLAADRPAAGAMGGPPALAVLPFRNLGGDPGEEYFSDGLTEELITALGRWRSFPVIARNSSFAYKGHALDARRIAEELGAAYLVEGSVRREGDRVRVAAQLVDGRSGFQVWANRYDRQGRDVLELQDELAHHIAAVLAPEVGARETEAAAGRTADPSAWDLHLRGRALLQDFSGESNARARALFEAAIALDPHYSDACAGLATGYTRDVLLGVAQDREAWLSHALTIARRAVALDPLSSVAHEALGTVHIWRDESDAALAEARLAHELNPSDALLLHGYGNKSDLAGDPEGIARMVQAQRLNLRDPDRHSHLSFLARAYVNARRYEDAAATAQEAISRRPDYPPAHYILAIALGCLGRCAAARAALDRCDQLQPGFVAQRADWRPYASPASNDHLAEGLRRARGEAP